MLARRNSVGLLSEEYDPHAGDALGKDGLDEIFDLTAYTKNVDHVFKRVFGKS